MSELWTPKGMVEVNPNPTMAVPEAGKADGGSYFDDEMDTLEQVQARVRKHMFELIDHLNARPDHIVYVSSVEDRDKMRAAFNVWKMRGLIGHNPKIKIEYGISEGGLRLAE